MASEGFLDPRDIINRAAEQELFAGLVSFATPARMMVISDKLGRGKSTLLRRLEYNCNCMIKPPVPASLVDLKDLPEPSPFAFVEKIVAGLNIDDRFPKFIALNRARINRDLGAFESGSGTAQAKVIREEVEIVTIRRAFTFEQEEIARKKCIEAFVDDLRVSCATQPIVILMDHWENCNYDLREWTRTTFLGEYCFHRDKNLRPAKLAIVVAGDTYDRAEQRFGIRRDEFVYLFDNEHEYKETVLLVGSLSDWDSEHVREFLAQHGYKGVGDEDIDYLLSCLQKGRALRTILSVAEALFKT